MITFAQNGICLVKKQDGRTSCMFKQCTIAFKDGFDVLLTFADPHAFHFRDIHLQHIPSTLSCQLQYALRLSRSWSAIEEAGESLTHAFFIQPFANQFVFLITQKVAETFQILCHTGIKKHLFQGNLFMVYDLIASVTRILRLKSFQQSLPRYVGQRIFFLVV